MNKVIQRTIIEEFERYGQKVILARVYRKGRVYANTYAMGTSEYKILWDVKNDKQSFKPFNESTFEYIT